MPDAHENSPSEAVLAFRREQQAELSAAVPFPDIDWSTNASTQISLAHLRNYVETVASSTISWYLRKIVWKRLFARILHVLTILAAASAASIELLNIATVLDFRWVRDILSTSANISSGSRAAEFTLLFVGIAGGFKVIDHAAGNTADWMRYRMTASAINTLISNFRFEWIELDRTYPLPRNGKPPGISPAMVEDPAFLPHVDEDTTIARNRKKKGDSDADPVQRRVVLARTCCNKILKLIENETSIWADELKKRMEAPVALNISPKDKRAD
jgi:SMODS and SLOG-associating 2TM effector domain 2